MSHVLRVLRSAAKLVRRVSGLVLLYLCLNYPGTVLAQADIEDVFQNALACALFEPLLADMPIEPVYTVADNACVSISPNDDASQSYFADAGCLVPLNFEPTDLTDHCNLLTDSTRLGEGQGVTEPVWTLSPGTQLDLGAKSLDGVHQPYLQRHVYRRVETAGGTCNLEMRVYSPKPGSEGLGSVLALHGGSWSSRGFGFFGLELTVPHYTDRGFVVYAPFYRLLGDSDGSPACNGATIEQISDDAEAALQWVRTNAGTFGSSAKPVVFGQSAGAHLALSLAVNHPALVAGGVLFYPPTDFTDFALRAQAGLYTNAQGLGILDKVIGVAPAEVDISASPVPENSFPIRIVESSLTPPPLMVVHGVADELVEVRQSVRLCDALAGRELLDLNADIEPLTELRDVVSCGSGSQLQLIREGQHALDVCLADAAIATDLCPAGSSASRQEVAQTITDAVDFADVAVAGVQPQPSSGSSGGGAFSAGSLAVLLIALLQTRLRRSFRHGYCCPM